MWFAHHPIYHAEETRSIYPDAIEGSGIAQNYEALVTKFLDDKEIHWTHFLSIEDDMLFSPDCLHLLARHRLPVVAANYSTNKGSRQRFTAATAEGTILTRPESTGIEEAVVVPQGFTLVAREVYEKIPQPWFMQGYSKETKRYVFQDYYFSKMAREAGFKLYVDHDCSKKVQHVGPHCYTWEDALRDELKGKADGAT